MRNRATGRAHPFRQPPAPAHGTADAAPARRPLPNPGALAELASRLRLDASIGVEDLGRLALAPEAEASTRPLAGLTARPLMSRDLASLGPATQLPDLAALLLRHRFKTLPMVEKGRYLGIVAEVAPLGRAIVALTAADLVQRLAGGQDQTVPIVEAGVLVGLLTRSDLTALLARALPRCLTLAPARAPWSDAPE